VRGRVSLAEFTPRHFVSTGARDFRTEWLEREAASPGRVLNLGSKDLKMGTVRVDIDPAASIHIRGDARNLPFKDNSFDAVIFSEVIEHLPAQSETRALSEVARVLAPKGRMILTTPASHPVYNILDLAWFLGHRHYRPSTLRRLLEESGFRIDRIFRGGGPGDALRNLLYQLLLYPGLFRGRPAERFQRWIARFQDPITEQDSVRGFTIFVEARKSAGQAAGVRGARDGARWPAPI